MKSDLLHVITCITNPVRYRSRYELYKRFEKRVLDAGAKFYTIEAAFGERPHAITSEDNTNHFQLQTEDELWHKENLLNIAIQRLPPDWKYLAVVDADVNFARPDWAAETVHLLQHYHVVQMWDTAQDLTPNFAPYQTHRGFVWCMQNGMDYSKQGKQKSYYKGGAYWHPGYCWAYTRDAINHLGGLLDTAILGAGDNHMAHALYGMAELSIPDGVTAGYRNSILRWEERAKYIHKDIGYMPGLILHDWHGKKRDRRYYDRWKIIVDNQFDPNEDLTRDWQGMWQIRPERIKLRDDIRGYFRSRNEDSIDID